MSQVLETPVDHAFRSARARPLRRRMHPGSLVTVTAMFVVSSYFLLPLYWLAVSSTKSASDLFGSSGLWFAHLNFLQNLHGLATYDGGVFFRWFVNSLIYAGGGAAGATVLALMAGYALAKHPFPGRRFALAAILGGIMVPITAIALPLYLMAAAVHLVNTYWAVLIPSFVSPFGVYLAWVYSEAGLPGELLEAARIDGAGEARILWSIVVPVLRPAIATIFLFQFIGIWNNFFIPLIMLVNIHLFPVTLGLEGWSGETQMNASLYSLVVSGSALSVIPLIVVIVLLQRFWRSGLTAGGLKG